MAKKLMSEGLAKALIYCVFSISVFSVLFFWHNARNYGAAAIPPEGQAEQPAPLPVNIEEPAAPLPFFEEASIETAAIGAEVLQDEPEISLAYRKEKWLSGNDETLPDMAALAKEVERINGMGFTLPSKFEMEYMGEYYATSYCCEAYKHICGGNGVTASGTVPTQGLTAAADWSILPRFTWLYIEGVGIRRVEDTGSAIKKARLDIAVDTHENALRWRGQGNRRVWVLAWG